MAVCLSIHASKMKIHGHDTVLIFRVAYNGHNKTVGSLRESGLLFRLGANR
jgi:hypothetical protein